MSVEQLHARRLLSHAAAAAASSAGPTAVQVSAAHTHAAAAPFSSLNTTVITVLSLLLCGLVVVLAVHAVVRCAFRVTRRVCYGQDEEPPGGGGDAPAASSSPSCQAGARRKRGPRTGLPPWIVYSREVELTGCGAAECAICLTEFLQGDRVRALPHCNHGFHVRCIDRWLAARQTCPTCRRAPFAPKPSLTDRAEAPEEAGQLQVHVEAGARQRPETQTQ